MDNRFATPWNQSQLTDFADTLRLLRGVWEAQFLFCFSFLTRPLSESLLQRVLLRLPQFQDIIKRDPDEGRETTVHPIGHCQDSDQSKEGSAAVHIGKGKNKLHSIALHNKQSRVTFNYCTNRSSSFLPRSLADVIGPPPPPCVSCFSDSQKEYWK